MASTDSEAESGKTKLESPTEDSTDLELAVQNEHDRFVAATETSRSLVNRMLDRDTPTLNAPGAAASGGDVAMPAPGAASSVFGCLTATVAPSTPTVDVATASGATGALEVVTTPGAAATDSAPAAETENPASGSTRRTASEELKRVKMAKRKREQKRKKKKRAEAAQAKAAIRQATASAARMPTGR